MPNGTFLLFIFSHVVSHFSGDFGTSSPTLSTYFLLLPFCSSFLCPGAVSRAWNPFSHTLQALPLWDSTLGNGRGVLGFIFFFQVSSFYVLIVAFDFHMGRFRCTWWLCTICSSLEARNKKRKQTKECRWHRSEAWGLLFLSVSTTAPPAHGRLALRREEGKGENFAQNCRPSVSRTPQRALHLLTQQSSDSQKALCSHV